MVSQRDAALSSKWADEPEDFGGVSAPFLFSASDVRELHLYCSLCGLLWFKTFYIGDFKIEWPSCDQLPVFPSSFRNAHVPWCWWEAVIICVGIKQEFSWSIGEIFLQSEGKHHSQPVTAISKLHPCSEACLKTGTAPCKKEYVKVMLMDDCCPELTLRCFVELGPVVGMGRQGNCNDISQKRWLQLLPPLLNWAVTSTVPFHLSWALTLLFTYHALLIALKAMMKGTTWLQAVTDDLYHVLSALAFNSVPQPHPPTYTFASTQ